MSCVKHKNGGRSARSTYARKDPSFFILELPKKLGSIVVCVDSCTSFVCVCVVRWVGG